MQPASKSVLSRLGPLTAQQRADMQALINSGIDPATARAIVQGYAAIGKAERPGYHEAYVAQARATLPSWQHEALHKAARASAGGHAAAVSRNAPDPTTAALAEIEALNRRIEELQGQVDKSGMLGSDVHVAVPIKRPIVKHDLERIYVAEALEIVAKAGFDESQHPRTEDGRFGTGSSGSHTGSGKRVYAGRAGGDAKYEGFSAQDHHDAAKIHAEHAESLQARHAKALQSGDKAKAARAATALAHVKLRQAQHEQSAAEMQDSAKTDPKPAAQSPSAASSSAAAAPSTRPVRNDRPLSAEEKDTIEAYTDTSAKGPSSFYQINRTLSGQSTLGEAKQKEALAHAKILNDAIEASPLAADTTLYRGMPFMHGLEAGQVLDSPSLLSFSADKDVASKFARGATGYSAKKSPEYGRQMVLKLAAPKGMPALDVNKKAGSSHENEAEFLVKSHQKFRVVGVHVESTVGEVGWGAKERHVVTIEPVGE